MLCCAAYKKIPCCQRTCFWKKLFSFLHHEKSSTSRNTSVLNSCGTFPLKKWARFLPPLLWDRLAQLWLTTREGTWGSPPSFLSRSQPPPPGGKGINFFQEVLSTHFQRGKRGKIPCRDMEPFNTSAADAGESRFLFPYSRRYLWRNAALAEITFSGAPPSSPPHVFPTPPSSRYVRVVQSWPIR